MALKRQDYKPTKKLVYNLKVEKYNSTTDYKSKKESIDCIEFAESEHNEIIELLKKNTSMSKEFKVWFINKNLLEFYYYYIRLTTPEMYIDNLKPLQEIKLIKDIDFTYNEYNDKEYNDKEYNDKEYNDKEYNDKEYNDKEYNNKEYNDKEYNDKKLEKDKYTQYDRNDYQSLNQEYKDKMIFVDEINNNKIYIKKWNQRNLDELKNYIDSIKFNKKLYLFDNEYELIKKSKTKMPLKKNPNSNKDPLDKDTSFYQDKIKKIDDDKYCCTYKKISMTQEEKTKLERHIKDINDMKPGHRISAYHYSELCIYLDSNKCEKLFDKIFVIDIFDKLVSKYVRNKEPLNPVKQLEPLEPLKQVESVV